MITLHLVAYGVGFEVELSQVASQAKGASASFKLVPIASLPASLCQGYSTASRAMVALMSLSAEVHEVRGGAGICIFETSPLPWRRSVGVLCPKINEWDSQNKYFRSADLSFVLAG